MQIVSWICYSVIYWMISDVAAARMLDVTHFACEDDIRCWGKSVPFNCNDQRKGKKRSLKKRPQKKLNRTPFRMHCVLIICRSRSCDLRERAVISLGEDRLSALTVGPVLQRGVNDKWWLSMEESKSIQIILETFHRRFINVSEGKAGTDREKWRAENS